MKLPNHATRAVRFVLGKFNFDAAREGQNKNRYERKQKGVTRRKRRADGHTAADGNDGG